MKNEAMIQICAPIILIILSSAPFSTSALTTFGKTSSNSQNQQTVPPTPVGKARECKMDSDCTAIRYTICMPDRRSGNNDKTQCLCGDYTAPINGACPQTLKAVYVPCSENSECSSGAVCTKKNNTTTVKTCECKDPLTEISLECSGAESISRFFSVALMAMALLFVQSIGYST